LVPNGHKFYHWTPSSTTPFYGITAVFARVEWDSTHALVAAFYFLPNTLTHASDDGVSPPLAFDSPFVTELVHGELFDVNTCWLDHSGCNMIAAIQESADSFLRLALVRYYPETRSTSTHDLSVPDTINLRDIDSLSFDDTAGAIHLVDNQGMLSTLRYISPFCWHDNC
jgi:hypothetical protein